MTLTEIQKAAEQIKDDWRRGDRAAAVGREHIVMTDFVRALSKGEVKATVIAMGAKAILEAIESGDRVTEARAMPDPRGHEADERYAAMYAPGGARYHLRNRGYVPYPPRCASATGACMNESRGHGPRLNLCAAHGT